MLESFMRRKTSERIKEGGKMQRRQRWEVKEEQAEEKETQQWGGGVSWVWLIARYHEVEIYSSAVPHPLRPHDPALISIETTLPDCWLDRDRQDQDVKEEVCLRVGVHGRGVYSFTHPRGFREVTHHHNKQKHFQSKQVILLQLAVRSPTCVCACVCVYPWVCFPLTDSYLNAATHKCLEK